MVQTGAKMGAKKGGKQGQKECERGAQKEQTGTKKAAKRMQTDI